MLLSPRDDDMTVRTLKDDAGECERRDIMAQHEETTRSLRRACVHVAVISTARGSAAADRSRIMMIDRRPRGETMITTNATVGLALGISLTAFTVVHAQKSKKPIVLSGTDYAEIEQLSARYSHAIDTCADDGYEYSRLYTTDGMFIDMWTQAGIDAGGIKWQGREKLREISSGANVTGGACTSSRFNGSVSHLILSIVITPTADGATGNAYMVELGGRDPNRITRMGNYEDVYVKTPEGWLFKTRTHSRAPNGTKPAPAAATPQTPAPR
jgi:hypothetical protein